MLAEKIWADKWKDKPKFDKACCDSFDAVFHGFLGEIIYADFYCVPRPTLTEGEFDGGTDFVIDGSRIQVKSTPVVNPPFYLILFPRELEKQVDYYALVSLDFEKSKATIIAEVPRGDFEAECFTKDFGYGERTVYLIA